MAKQPDNREYITALSINQGVITLVEPNGEVAYYRQRGIGSLPNVVIPKLISMGALSSRWNTFKELPKNYSISFEDEEVMGKAFATFNAKRA